MTTASATAKLAETKPPLGAADLADWIDQVGLGRFLHPDEQKLAVAALRAYAAHEALIAAINESDGCFEAALAEGWVDAVESGEVATIRDLWHRRLSVARSLFPAALAQAKGGAAC